MTCLLLESISARDRVAIFSSSSFVSYATHLDSLLHCTYLNYVRENSLHHPIEVYSRKDRTLRGERK